MGPDWEVLEPGGHGQGRPRECSIWRNRALPPAAPPERGELKSVQKTAGMAWSEWSSRTGRPGQDPQDPAQRTRIPQIREGQSPTRGDHSMLGGRARERRAEGQWGKLRQGRVPGTKKSDPPPWLSRGAPNPAFLQGRRCLPGSQPGPSRPASPGVPKLWVSWTPGEPLLVTQPPQRCWV